MRIVALWRRRAVGPALAAAQLVLARARRLHRGKIELTEFRISLLYCGSDRRNFPIGRIDNQRRPPARRAARREDPRVVSAGDVIFGALRRAFVTEPEGFGASFFVELSSFRDGEKLFSVILRGSMKMDMVLVA